MIVSLLWVQVKYRKLGRAGFEISEIGSARGASGGAVAGRQQRRVGQEFLQLANGGIVSQGELSTDLELDRDIYAVSDTLTARLNIRNSTGDPATPGVLSFSTGQMYDLEIRDGDGQVVALWSRGKAFA